jgi:hypothetical protein
MAMRIEYRATIKKPEKLIVNRIIPNGVQDFMVKSLVKEAYELKVSDILIISLSDISELMNIKHNKNGINFSPQDVYDSLDRLRISGEVEYDKELSFSKELKYKIYGVR